MKKVIGWIMVLLPLGLLTALTLQMLHINILEMTLAMGKAVVFLAGVACFFGGLVILGKHW
jgi:Na+/H+-dicarboxylate symporter